MYYNKRGHFTLKSSVLSPTAMSYMGQDLIANHMKSHYRRVLSAKASVDTSPPKSMKAHIKVCDQNRRAALENRSRAQSNLSLRTIRSPSMELLTSTQNPSPLNSTRSRPSSGLQQTARTPMQRSSTAQSFRMLQPTPDRLQSPAPAFSSPRGQPLDQLSENCQTTSTLQQLPPPPPVSPIEKEARQSIRTRESRHSRGFRTQLSHSDSDGHVYPNPAHRDNYISTLMMHDEFNETHSRNKEFANDDPVDDKQGQGFRKQRRNHAVVPRLNLTDVSFSHRGPPTVRTNESDIKSQVWEEEQQYLKFISDVTTDVLARGIFSNRVLSQVFELHIERNKDNLDEDQLRDMIEELKQDLGIMDS